MLVTMEDVRERNPSELLVDCRAAERYSGHNETIDTKAGHIPGAFNVPWEDLVEKNGCFRGVGHLAEQLTAVDERSIMYCGSGVTACVNILAAEQAALGVPRLYAGSWSDWITWAGNEIVTGR
jgi:thiosulfate/3-mercaptopyruvate sulfurtransferase